MNNIFRHRYTLGERKEIDTVIPCGSDISYSNPDGTGVYYRDIELGTGTGICTFNYDSGDIPDRFKLKYNNQIVFDSKFVGDYLEGNPPDSDISKWRGSPGHFFVGRSYKGVKEFYWNGEAYSYYGTKKDFEVKQSDVADFGNTSGQGYGQFVKTNAYPTKITVIVYSFPRNTGWSYSLTCPE